jgi:transketolase
MTPTAPTGDGNVARRTCANALRVLALDTVQRANSGHPGMPMGMADIAEALWRHRLRHNPANPSWFDRDRFVLSNGHGSALQYALLHLSGYDLPIDELKRFRQLHSRTPGHPERGLTPGIETTTGPLGQGLANAVGMALAERLLAAEFNRDGLSVIDHRTWVFLGDGCLMEGISQEAVSLAGTWKLGKLVAFWDDNGISIDGHVEGWFTDDTPARFEACGWRVMRGVDGHDSVALDAAIDAACANDDRPTLICCKTVIGQGAPTKAGTHDCHGAPLGEAEIAATRAALDWPHAPFEVPGPVRRAWEAREAGARAEADWNERFAAYRRQHPALADELQRRIAGRAPAGFDAHAARVLAEVDDQGATIASRKASQNMIGAFAPLLPELIGGSADLAASNLTLWPQARAVKGAGSGNYLNYGVREFGMAAIVNGIAAHGGLRPFCATFLMFSEYARNALRMAALMKLNPIFVFTHDSIGLGEDGPTHQPVEQMATLRLMPGMDLWRPCDAVETCVAWSEALAATDHPTCLVFSRQNLPHQVRDAVQLSAIRRGGYVLRESALPLAAVLIATGSEVALAIDAQRLLHAQGVGVRVVSMPSTRRFDQQDAAWRDAVLPRGVPRVAIEAGVSDYWRKYVGLDGAVLGIDTFGESAPAAALYEHFGLTAQAIVRLVESVTVEVRA